MLLGRPTRHCHVNQFVGNGLSSNSAVPTVMLVTTSVLYVVLFGSRSVATIIVKQVNTTSCDGKLLESYLWLVLMISDLVYAYNFYVYLVTGRQFRADLRSLLCSCRCPNVNAANDNAAAVTVATRRHIDTRV